MLHSSYLGQSKPRLSENKKSVKNVFLLSTIFDFYLKHVKWLSDHDYKGN